MAIISNINGKLTVSDQGQVSFNRIGTSTTTGYTFPALDGTPNQILKTNGDGILSFVIDENSGGTVTGTGTENKVVRWTDTAGEIGDGPITFSSAGAAADSTFGGGGTFAADVGIKKAGAGALLYFQNTASVISGIRAEIAFYNSDTSTVANIRAAVDTSTTDPAPDNVGTDLAFFTRAIGGSLSQKMVIKGGGNVGIGDNTPTSKLTILGTSTAASNTASQAIVDIQGTSTAHLLMGVANVSPFGAWINTDGIAQPLVLMGTGGNVGIGTSTPDAKLEVEGDVNSGLFSVFAKNPNAGDAAYVSKKWLNDDAGFGEIWRNSSTRTSAGQGAKSFNMYNSDDINFWDNGLHTMALVDNKVGIGTIAPGALLQVGNGTAPSSTDQQGAHIYGYDGALSLYTTRQGESPFNAALYLYNNPAAGTGTGTGILFRAKTGGGGPSEYTEGRIQGAVYTSWTTNTDATRTSKMVFRTTDSASTTDKVTILGNGNTTITGIVGMGSTGIYANTGAQLNLPGRGLAIKNDLNGSSNNWSFIEDTAGGSEANLNFHTGNNSAALTLSHIGDATFTKKVGIGSSTIPGVPLDVSGGAGGASIRVRGDMSSGSYYYGFMHDGTKVQGTTQSNIFFAAGVVNGGTTIASWSGLRIEAPVVPAGSSVTNSFGINQVSSAQKNFFNGSVGIGIDQPATKLHVVGAGTQAIFQTTASYSDIKFVNSTHTNFLNFSGATFIVYQGGGSGSNVTFAVDSGGTATFKADVVAFGSPSDKRLKENIKPIESALDKIIKLQGVTFDWKEKAKDLDKEGNPIDLQQWKHDIGFIAQDVQKVIPELIRENDNGMLSMRHQGIAPILLEAIKELKAEIEELKNKPCNCNCK